MFPPNTVLMMVLLLQHCTDDGPTFTHDGPTFTPLTESSNGRTTRAWLLLPVGGVVRTLEPEEALLALGALLAAGLGHGGQTLDCRQRETCPLSAFLWE